MEIVIVRKYLKPTYTIGTMMVDGKYFSDTLELPDRGMYQGMPKEEGYARKIKGNTAIPVGRYPVVLEHSNFTHEYHGKNLPLLCGVDCFTGVRIHHGNSVANTEGCILIGQNTSKGMLSDTQKTVEVLIDWMMVAITQGEEVFITIRYPQ